MRDKPATPRQIVVCCDGTNNTLTGGNGDTNVVQLHNHLAALPISPEVERILYYDPGVGSSGLLPPVGPIEWLARTWDRASGLASGSGVYDNIAAAYLFLMRHWRDDADRIYLFGFSRGAFTVRAVAGMVQLFGVVRPEYVELVPTLVHLYFAPSGPDQGNLLQRATGWVHSRTGRGQQARAETGGHPKVPRNDRKLLADEVRANFSGPGRDDAWVHWIGVWDTVESVGLPGPFSRANPATPSVLDKRFLNVRHALSLDEHRWPFLPRLYAEPGDIDRLIDVPGRTVALHQTLKQRWYPGVHCDVGGSYPVKTAGLSDTALHWMVDEVAGDMNIPRLPRPAVADGVTLWRHDPLWDMPYWALAGMTLRDMHPLLPETPTRPPTPFKAIPADNLPAEPIGSVWEKRRPWWPVALSTFLGLLCLIGSGLCLIEGVEVGQHHPTGWLDWWLTLEMAAVRTIQAAQDFGDQQLAALWLQGLFASGHRPWELPVQPGWAMFWDLLFIACWGYLIARATSRAFAWLAGDRDVTSSRPSWRWLGFAPMVAVVSDVAEDLAVWASLALHAVGTDALALGAIWLSGLGALLKFAGLAGCLALMAVRWRIGFNPGMLWPGGTSVPSTSVRPPRHRHHIGDAFAGIALSLAALGLWMFARLTICWGQHNWFGVGSCHSHLASIALAGLAIVPLVRLGRSIALPAPIPRGSGGAVASIALNTRGGPSRAIGAGGMAAGAMALLMLTLLVALLIWLIAGTDILF